jgi:hypothetical protein
VANVGNDPEQYHTIGKTVSHSIVVSANIVWHYLKSLSHQFLVGKVLGMSRKRNVMFVDLHHSTAVKSRYGMLMEMPTTRTL